MAYGAVKVAACEKQPPPAANGSCDDFALEMAGREAQCRHWAKARAEGAPPHAALDRQLEVYRAGFLPELVVLIWARPGWTIPAATVSALRLQEFVEKFPGDYTPGMPVVVQSASGKRFPGVPGGDFPDPAKLPVGPSVCATALRERAVAWERWSRLDPTLGGAPVSATSTMRFGRQLMAVKNDPRYARGVTWVSDRVAHLAMVDGFCAVEAQDWPRAGEVLTRAAALDPANPHTRLELGLALTKLRRFDDALAEADRVLSSTEDGCAIGKAWRQRGYVLFEQGALDGARAAYEQSLVVDPGNNMAEQELKLIAGARQQHGDMKQRPSFKPPPSLGTVITSCRPRPAPSN
jgi:hypothetical protein